LQLDLIKTHRWNIAACSAVAPIEAIHSDDPNDLVLTKGSQLSLNILQGMDWVVNDVASRVYLVN
jgi:ADP-ribosylation factor-like protein 2